MLNNVMAYLPNVIGAGFVFFVGYVIAKIARQPTQTTLDTAGLDRGVARLADGQMGYAAGARDYTVPGREGGAMAASEPGHVGGAMSASEMGTDGTAGTSLSSVVASLVFAVVLIVVSIAALQILGIRSISDPFS